MNERVKKLREQSLKAIPSITAERAKLITEFYKSPEAGRMSYADAARPGLQAHPGEQGDLHQRRRADRRRARPGAQGHSDLSRGHLPQRPGPGDPRFPAQDLVQVRRRTIRKIYKDEIIPFWRGRSIRDRMLAELPQEWKDAYEAGIFTEFMEQRAPGHTVLDDKIYRKGMLDFIADIDAAIAKLDFLNDPEAFDKREELRAMRVAAEALITLRRAARREGPRAGRRRKRTPTARRSSSASPRSARWVPAHAPRDFWEALQDYWFVHLGVITELQHLGLVQSRPARPAPLAVLREGLEDGTLTEEGARELLQCFWVKFNNQPAPPKVGVTAEESGTYTDFALINVGGLKADGSDGVNELSVPPPRRHRGDAHPPAELHGPDLEQETRTRSCGGRSRSSRPASASRRSSTPTPSSRN